MRNLIYFVYMFIILSILISLVLCVVLLYVLEPFLKRKIKSGFVRTSIEILLCSLILMGGLAFALYDFFK